MLWCVKYGIHNLFTNTQNSMPASLCCQMLLFRGYISHSPNRSAKGYDDDEEITDIDNLGYVLGLKFEPHLLCLTALLSCGHCQCISSEVHLILNRSLCLPCNHYSTAQMPACRLHCSFAQNCVCACVCLCGCSEWRSQSMTCKPNHPEHTTAGFPISRLCPR